MMESVKSYIPEVLPGSFDEKSNPFKVLDTAFNKDNNQRQQMTEVRKTEMKPILKPSKVPSNFEA